MGRYYYYRQKVEGWRDDDDVSFLFFNDAPVAAFEGQQEKKVIL
jgi:hypothetical protein